jgi:hypothetical protein
MQASRVDVKTVKVPMTLELLQGVFDDGSRKNVTVNQYIAHITRLFKGLFGLNAEIDDFEWVKDSKKVLDYFETTYGDKLSMQATCINPLLVIVRKEYPKDQELYQAYYTRYQAIRKMMDDACPPP